MLIYLISFVEAFAVGLTGINLALYLKFVLKLTEIQAAGVLSSLGLLGSILIFVCGPLIDKYGIKKCGIVGAVFLAIGRIILGLSGSFTVAIACFILMALGSAIKSSSVLVFIKKHKKSFKIDYIVFNIAYCVSGILFDMLKDYSLIYLVSGLSTALNIILLVMLPADEKHDPIKVANRSIIDPITLRTVLIYNCIMLPVSSLFVFMGSFVPKWAIQVLGPEAPVGKLYGSLNPAIIMIIVPLFLYLQRFLKKSAYYYAVLGTALSAGAFFLLAMPGSYYFWVIAAIIVFTIGEAIWSPANMEVGAHLCPEGQEGKYMTISLVPRVLSGFFMSYFLAYNFNHFVYNPNPTYYMPFILMGAIALLTPICLILFKRSVDLA